jgi:hypothetical protein
MSLTYFSGGLLLTCGLFNDESKFSRFVRPRSAVPVPSMDGGSDGGGGMTPVYDLWQANLRMGVVLVEQ